MSALDQGRSLTLEPPANPDDPGPDENLVVGSAQVTTGSERALQVFLEFIRLFRPSSDDTEPTYSEQLARNIHNNKLFVDIRVDHLRLFSPELVNALIADPTRILRTFERAAVEYAESVNLITPPAAPTDPNEPVPPPVSIQVILFATSPSVRVRELTAAHVALLVAVPGLVVAVSRASCQIREAVLKCRTCSRSVRVTVPAGQPLDLPPKCLASSISANGRSQCKPNPYVLIPDLCSFVDTQTLRLQELPDGVPAGELPRSVSVVVDRALVDTVKPGLRVTIVGIPSLGAAPIGAAQRGSVRTGGLRRAVLRAVGVLAHTGCDVQSVVSSHTSHDLSSVAAGDVATMASARLDATASSARAWSAADEPIFREMAEDPTLRDRIAASIDPAVFGHDDIKRAISLQLFGGTAKTTTDGASLRGSIHVLLVGDPSTAKSQLLKFAEKAAPMAVYSSGKSSSAAGLTAAVVRDKAGDFTLEGGAMVLADGGLACIDEFDKMRAADRVAIHEAMEQQTVSVSKAGLNATVNARTSVLAAANPILGTFDAATSDETLEFGGSILSRFDLIFQVIDTRDPARDAAIARHVVAVHKAAGGTGPSAPGGGGHAAASAMVAIGGASGAAVGAGGGGASSILPLPLLRAYIAFARSTVFPRLDDSARGRLRDFFVSLRRDSARAVEASVAAAAVEGGKKGAGPVIRITVRQLEALIRLSEASARMRLRSVATAEDVECALRLFVRATVQALGVSNVIDEHLSPDVREGILRVESFVRSNVPVGHPVALERLRNELSRMSFDEQVITRSGVCAELHIGIGAHEECGLLHPVLTLLTPDHYLAWREGAIFRLDSDVDCLFGIDELSDRFWRRAIYYQTYQLIANSTKPMGSSNTTYDLLLINVSCGLVNRASTRRSAWSAGAEMEADECAHFMRRRRRSTSEPCPITIPFVRSLPLCEPYYQLGAQP